MYLQYFQLVSVMYKMGDKLPRASYNMQLQRSLFQEILEQPLYPLPSDILYGALPSLNSVGNVHVLLLFTTARTEVGGGCAKNAELIYYTS